MAAKLTAMLEDELSPPKPVQRWTAADYAKNGRFVQELAGPLLDMLAPRPAKLETGMKGWLETFGRFFFEQSKEAERSEVLAEVIELLRPSLCTEGGEWTADHIRLRFGAELAS